MRILFVIAHFYSSNGDKKYGSGSSVPDNRINALTKSIMSIHQHFNKHQSVLNIQKREIIPVSKQENSINIVVCTTGNSHILNQLPISKELYIHHNTNTEPMLLGFECQQVLKNNIENYDYFCFLEDDLIIHDPGFFTKLKWFNSKMGNGVLLQPNRYESSLKDNMHKLYIDGNLKPETTAKYQNINENNTIIAHILDEKITLQRPLNPHSGCYFLNKEQLKYWISQPYFDKIDTSFIGPLESAATLGIMKTFKIYKPSSNNYDFLEIQHYGDSFIRRISSNLSRLVSSVNQLNNSNTSL